jgi:intracellular multiplication protein IcmG
MAGDKDVGKENEEYQLGDADLMGPDLSSSEPESSIQDVPKEEGPAFPGMISSVTHRNALIVIGVLFAALLIYSLAMWFNSSSVNIPKKNVVPVNPPAVKPVVVKPAAVKPAVTKPAIIKPAEVPSIQEALPVKSTSMQVNTESTSVLVDQKIKEMTSEQSKIQSDLQSMGANVSGVQTTVQDVNTKLTSLMTAVDALNKTIEAQANLIKGLQATCTVPPKITHHRAHVIRRHIIHGPKLYIQAIIPGRAWLIRENGTATMTVREGTRIPGYGIVQLIDPLQGRVVLSSGAVITFGQWDS